MRYHQRAAVVLPESGEVRRHALWGRSHGSCYCPRCLAASGGRWRLSWRLGWSFACIDHQVLLADTCWQCHRLQRMHVTPAGLLPVPGRCTNPDGTIGRRASRSRCGADLIRTDVLALPDGHPVLRAQHHILESVHNGTADFGPYAHKPVADFLRDVRTLSRIILTHSDHQELARRIPADIADAFARARALPHSKTSPTASPVRPGFAAPARAEIAAAAITIVTDALTRDSTDQAATALAWLFAPRPGQRAGRRPLISGRHASDLVLSIQRDALHHVKAATTTRSAAGTDRSDRIPGLFWPLWTVALSPSHRHLRQTFRDISHGLSVLLALINSTGTIGDASRRLGTCSETDHIAQLLHQLRSHPDWPAAEIALIELADQLDRIGSPIDYRRRRSLDFRQLLPASEWRALARRAHHFSGNTRAPRTACRWLFERISGLPAEQAPTAFTPRSSVIPARTIGRTCQRGSASLSRSRRLGA